MMATQKVSIYPILAVNFVGTLGFSIVLPFLIFLVTRWGGNAFIYGVVGATYSAFQLVGAPILGRWSDRIGRRKVLLISQVGTLFSWLILLSAFALPTTTLIQFDSGWSGAFVLTLPLLFVFLARAADGLTGGNVSVASAYLADISTEENRSTNFGKLSVAGNLGFIAGPALAGILGGTAAGEIVPVIAAVAISVVATLVIAFGLPESKPCPMQEVPNHDNAERVFGQENKPCYEIEAAPISTREIVRLPGIRIFLAIYFFVMFGFNFFYVAFPVHATTGLNWTPQVTGTFFAVLGAMMALVQGPVLGWATKKWSDEALLSTGSLILVGSFALFTLPSTVMIYLAAALLALGNGLMWPSASALLSKRAGDRYQGAVQGLAGSLGATASILGLLLGGAIFDLIGESIFWISAGIILVVCLLSLRVRR